ncbi:DUF4174 domain-containing protein [Lutimaribacter sp. EGI FJ00015]|uniref:DUF4174 domain-containing protein n=1 Tax=Lutimaribacter degradans TaxID=2945989 RepID=A0ACC5ZR00_9RHOB|nr:DUF4174 domain-containing protein [Lutimaribacter sp. EGI FJ00013]MCM2560550.1 DUF4174 domain-containing protein [Lutimaribacter sp. EGI FJ00013]MCO0612507.1 DUF4174 domain-containing protein [Lutimaribacter sp. EGI FJ00015]MCO0634374.1 DUF4174 domain-containing protein [Lutimaribacter sp. EGI FJ00014]
MKHVLAFAIAIFFTVPAAAQDTAEPEPELPLMSSEGVELDQFLWVSRLVIVFADSPNDPRYIEQMQLLREDPGPLLQRDVVVLTDTTPQAESALRRALYPRGFSLVIISKDGQTRIRKPLPFDVREITRSIDKMPIRQREIREMNTRDSG